MGQIKATGDAKAAGPCSAAVSGNNNRLIINCQGDHKEKVDAPSFHEKSGMIYFSLGEHGITTPQTMETLRKGPYVAVFISGGPVVTMEIKNDALLLTFELRSPDGRILLKLKTMSSHLIYQDLIGIILLTP